MGRPRGAPRRLRMPLSMARPGRWAPWLDDANADDTLLHCHAHHPGLCMDAHVGAFQ